MKNSIHSVMWVKTRKRERLLISGDKTINFSFDTLLCFLGFGQHVGIISIKNKNSGTSLMIQWLRLCLPMQGCGLDPWSGNWDPMPHKTEVIL